MAVSEDEGAVGAFVGLDRGGAEGSALDGSLPHSQRMRLERAFSEV